MSLWKLRSALVARSGPLGSTYRIPMIWNAGLTGTTKVDPYEFYIKTIDEILALPKRSVVKDKGWTSTASVYNLFIRSALAFDHDGDGTLGGSKDDCTINADGLRETGTFLKAIALLPHIARLGVDVVYLLPITSIGGANAKGDLGSPYAIRNPYKLDETLGDPMAGDMSPDEQFAAFCEAAHHLGMRIVLEFVFRTAAQDADWASEHPDWFYWIKADCPDRSEDAPDGYGNPRFTSEQMERITRATLDETGSVRTSAQVKIALEAGQGELVEPPRDYIDLYTECPTKVVKNQEGHWRGQLPSGGEARIPGAFADWPPDDVQPPWTDVTYLRMYGKPSEHFDYMAYNTLRLYDPRLAEPEKGQKELWDTIANIVPHYQKSFGIDGVMIDMGHALPLALAQDIQRRARENDEGFAFWEEKFSLDPESPKTGYEAVVGPCVFTLNTPTEAKRFLGELGDVPCNFFATAENHNTPRVAAGHGGKFWAKAAWATALYLPGSIAFIHNGMEVLELSPLNTGLNFTPEDLERLKDLPLGLFDRASLSWETGGDEMVPFIQSTMALRRRYQTKLSIRFQDSYRNLWDLPEGLLGYQRLSDGKPFLTIVVNSGETDCTLGLSGTWLNILGGKAQESEVTLPAQSVGIFETV